MKIIRYQITDGENYGILTKEGVVYRALGSISHGFEQGERVGNLTDLKLLPPVIPSKIVAVGRNYKAHAEEFNRELPTEPAIFLKPPSSIIAHGETVLLPNESNRVDHEGELAIVIGKRSKNVPEGEVPGVIFGYTCANDVTARDLQQSDVQWTRGKGFDTFCPLGPWIETEYDPENKNVECSVDNDVRQSSNTSFLLFTVNVIVSYISKIMTLEPGDVILTGTPEGVGRLENGNIVEVTIEGIGTLKNPVVSAPKV